MASRGSVSNWVTTVGLFSALSLATDYALLPFPNVKLMDALVFLSGFCFGLRVGVPVAVITWLVYGTINPLGPAGFPLILVLMLSETIYAATAALLRGRTTVLNEASSLLERHLFLGAVGATTTFAYDLVTNLWTGIVFYGSALLGLLYGVPFALVHEASNALIFAVAIPPLVNAIKRVAILRGIPFSVGVR